MASKVSPFLYPGVLAKKDSLAIIHLKRDLQNPTILRERDEDDEGYAEGKVVNTRFGSFPHIQLIGLPWGTQVRAYKVDTGSRGRRGGEKAKDEGEKHGEKRKRENGDEPEGHNDKSPRLSEQDAKGEQEIDEIASIMTPAEPQAERPGSASATGFIHLLPPTPENWTSSLPHRTQVVYTPDYSYILHRIRARPGTNIIEAGAGSGSFTHASARAVYSGYPETSHSAQQKRKIGKVWSYEFHEQRHEKLQEEIRDHGIDKIVQITHRDVCENGFLVDGKSPNADAIFLDLPAPWLALPHLLRSKNPPKSESTPHWEGTAADETNDEPRAETFLSALNPSCPVHICTFSPCIEQVQKTMSAMRRLGWVDIEMVEMSQKALNVRRDRIGIDNGQQHGILSMPASVDEAISRLKSVEGAFKNFHGNGEKAETKKRDRPNPNNKEKILEGLVDRKIYKEGNLVHRAEMELKTHTSYLVFAVLPQEWTEEDEEKARLKWATKACAEDVQQDGEAPLSKRKTKRAARLAQKEREAAEKVAVAEDVNGTKVGGQN